MREVFKGELGNFLLLYFKEKEAMNFPQPLIIYSIIVWLQFHCGAHG